MKKVLGLVLGFVLPATMAAAQIQYAINGGTPAALPGSRIINVGTLTSGVSTLHIFDSSGIDESIVGQVEIQGTATSTALLRIKVVNQTDTDAFAEDELFPLVVGLRDFGGLRFSSDSLRDRSVLALSIQGDITGPIDVGQVWRIDAFAEANNAFGGYILGAITAHKPDNAVIADAPSIGYIRAGIGIGEAADITAVGERDGVGRTTAYASIGRVVVGPITNDVGIQGDIIADDGRIGSVFSTGPIGRPFDLGYNAPTIRAGDGILEIRVMREDLSGEPIIKDIIAAIQSNAMMERMALTEYDWTDPRKDGVLTRLETPGNLPYDLMIRAGNIASNPDFGGSVQPGIYVGGECHSTIRVDWNVLHANLIARSFNKPIEIGRFLRGCVVATGYPDEHGVAAGGGIGSLEIGLRDGVPVELVPYEEDEEHPQGFRGMDSRYSDYGVGFCGIDAEPFTASADEHEWFTQAGRDSTTAIDGVIRATGSIGSCQIRAVGLDYELVSGAFDCESYMPRIEAPTIMGLRIDDFRAGTVWSGKLAAENYDEYYTNISISEEGQFRIGCMSPYARVWMRDWFFEPPNTNVTVARFEQHVLGNIHVPRIGELGAISIGRELADFAEATFSDNGEPKEPVCRCWPFEGELPCALCVPLAIAEQSPRNPSFPDAGCATAGRGKIWIEEEEGLEGQIIINRNAAAYSPVTQWSGEVDIGFDDPPSTLCPGKIIAHDGVAPDFAAPHYGIPSQPLGGGAVGLVPYRLYKSDSEPAIGTPGSSSVNPLILVPSQLNDVNGLDLAFYGPVYAEVEGLNPLRVYRQYQGLNSEYYLADVTCKTTQTPRPGDLAGSRRDRVLRVRGPEAGFPLGAYQITTLIYTATYVCDTDSGTSDPLTTKLRCSRPGYIGTVPDPVPDPMVGGFSLYIKVVPGGSSTTCYADVDDGSGLGVPDSGVDINDLLFFLLMFEGGNLPADLDDGTGTGTPDFGVDINDLLFFLFHFEVGC